MKKLVMCLLALVVLLSACMPYMYDIPQDRWDRMSERERTEAVRAYERREAERERAAAEQARREELQRERERARQAEEERLRRERVEAIRHGEGAYGELLRIRLQGGKLKLGDRHHRYQPFTFTIAEGEAREIEVADRKGRDADLLVSYAGGVLTIDGRRFPYDRSWGSGNNYPDISTSGRAQLRDVDVFIEIVGRQTRYDRDQPRIVIIREELPVHEREPLKPPAMTAPPRAVEVAFVAGEMKLRGGAVPVKPFAFIVRDGESREVALTAGEERRTLSVSYDQGEVIIDTPSRKGRREVSLQFTREWQKGRTYQFTLKGKPSLDQVEVRITSR